MRKRGWKHSGSGQAGGGRSAQSKSKDNRRTKKRVSRTDPEAAYEAAWETARPILSFPQTLDSGHGIIISLTVTPGMSMTQSPIWSSWNDSSDGTPIGSRGRGFRLRFSSCTGNWKSWGSHSLSGPKPYTTAHRSSNVMRFPISQIRTATFAPRENTKAKGCTAVPAGCSGSIRRRRRTASAARCGQMPQRA